MNILRKKINITLLFFIMFLFGLYIYQTISISSGMVSLVNLKKEFLDRKNDLNSAVYSPGSRDDFEPSFIKETLKMAEIEKFDYIIIGPSEFVLIEDGSSAGRQ